MASNEPSTARSKGPWVIHPVAFAAQPVLSLYAHNVAQVPVVVVVVPAVILVGVAMVLWLLLRLALRSYARSGLILSFLLVAFFSYRDLYAIMAPPDANVVSLPLNAMLSGVFILGLAYIVFVCIRSMRTGTHLPAVTRLVNAVGVVLVLLPIVRVGAHVASTWSGGLSRPVLKDRGHHATTRPTKGPLPNIYYVILDAYARSDVRRTLYYHDNTPFLDHLRKRGFYIAEKSRSNYYLTSQSLTSAMNFRYLPQIVDPRLLESRVVTFLKEHGYVVAAFSSGIDTTELTGCDVYLRPVWTMDDFQNKLLSSTPIGVLLQELGVWDPYEMHRRRILYALDHLHEAPRPGTPTFVFAHILCPHPPFVFGPNGEERNRDVGFDYSDADHLVRDGAGGITRLQYARQYIDQVKFIDRRVQEAVDRILETADRPTVIILQGDHGPRSRLRWGRLGDSCVTECLSILNAYYVAGQKPDGLHERITPVNTFRVLLNHVFGTEYDLLPDRSYFSTGTGKMVDVTKMIDREERVILQAPTTRPAGPTR